MNWEKELEESRADGGLLVSKVSPPSGCMCDHKESVWEYHKKDIQRAAQKLGFIVAYETKTLVSLVPRPEEKGCKCSKRCEKCESVTPRTDPPSGSAPAQHEFTC